MNRSDLIASLATRFHEIRAEDIDFSTKLILEAIGKALARGDRIEVRGFGSFQRSYRPPHVGRNPLSGDEVEIPGKFRPYFKPGKCLREKIDATRDSSMR